jgi:shikimate dehydrogenase
MEYGLIGEKLGHSFSKIIHEQLADYTYELCPLPKEQVGSFLTRKEFRAINVTIPYKEMVIPYCDEVAPQALAIGAVNTIVNREGRLYGYNTDFGGFLYLLHRHGIFLKGKKVLVLGTGATSKTVCAVARSEGAAQITLVSRHGGPGCITYEEAATKKETQIILNASPAGMYPENDAMVVDLENYPALEGVADVIYNPLRTNLVLAAKQRGLKAAGGLEMLVAQAKYAIEYFQDSKINEEEIEKVYCSLLQKKANIVLIGMPSSGKSSVGKGVSRVMNMPFIDLDKEIEKEAEMPIPQIFDQFGEEYFRNLEEQVTARFAKEGGQVLSTGGGVVKRPSNVRRLRQNGVVFYLDRSLYKLQTGGQRPLSSDREALLRMKRERAPIYRAACDKVIKNNGRFKDAVVRIKESYYEIICHKWAKS